MLKRNQRIEIRNLKLDIEEDEDLLVEKAAKKLGISQESIRLERILRKSIDARKKERILRVYSVIVKVESEKDLRLGGDILLAEEFDYTAESPTGTERLRGPVIVVGSGPAGMFAALELAREGYRPWLVERGGAVPERSMAVERFIRGGSLDLESNIQFGEGGAGTFSDGKLTTRIKDYRCSNVFDTFVKFGAPKEILYSNKPHIGTDILKEVVVNIRQEILRLGGRVDFNTRLLDVEIPDGSLKSVTLSGIGVVEPGALILAIGHSSRDTYEMLFNRGVAMEPKAFAIGLRVEHRQSMLNEIQYGKYADHRNLGAADYSLAMRSVRTGRAAYSFCMCPGGYVMAATSEEKQVVVNGMSEYARSGENANSALVVNVSPEDFGIGIMDGIYFQRNWERAAYRLGGENYFAPVESIGSFLGKGKGMSSMVRPTYAPGTQEAELANALPEYVTETLREGILEFGQKLKGFADGSGILTGVETRTSAPLRITRNESNESVNVRNLYPCGEGAGYAGGIVSAAVDGIRCAGSLMSRFQRRI